uniref:Curli production assembly/transport component CsgG n=1 Tax=Candidatus Kentrum sp. FW TaxID=2126338 RepID=A0A450S7A5_9GAMM|nr:MAG: Curli production assembly/transport component CsgG [Candidatus Kentron sp. FW]VFJ62280.1 MAG: Curli production assembly/transport component CsgG [Candidatus Kentron sp. FW]
MKRIYSVIFSLSFLYLLAACGSTYVEEDPAAGLVREEPVPTIPSYTGPKTAVAVLPLGLSARAAKRYPHLLEKSVGLGVHNMVLDVLFDTKRFRFVEEKPEIIEDIINRQVMSQSGFVAQEKAIEYGKMLGARKVIYGEVFEYAQGGETISGFSARQGFRHVVGVQIVYTDVETGEKLSFGSDRAFGSSHGEATDKAIRRAVYKMIDRL